MSVNALLNDDSSKGWSNLYVNSLTTYKDVTVKGKLKLEGELQLGTSLNGTSRVFSQTFSKSGASVDNTNFVTLKFIELGGVVTCFIPEFDTFANGITGPLYLTPTSPMPDKYFPGDALINSSIGGTFHYVATKNSNSNNTPGNLFFRSTGVIEINTGISTSNGARIPFNSSPLNFIGIDEKTNITYLNKIINP
jgi:hypothetical protein